MSSPEASSLERCLLAIVRREVEALGIEVSPPVVEGAADAFLRALRDGHDGHDGQFGHGVAGGTARLEEALTVAVRAGARAAGREVDYAAPTVLVRPRDEHGRTVERALEATVPAGTVAAGDVPRTVLLTDRLTGEERAATAADGERTRVVVEVETEAGREAWRELAERSAPADPLVGESLDGKYRIEKVLGRGGFGVVYKAADRLTGAPVAIKTIHAAGAGRAHLDDFKEEARRVTRLDHPNIVQWKALNEASDGTLYFVMEFLEGEELEDALVREERFEPKRAGRLLLQILDALRAAHHLRSGGSILHLDLKPKNVFLTRDAHGEELAKVIDFGIGQLAGGAAEAAARAGGNGVRRVTACTPPYCSPEQARHVLPGFDAGPLDGRADLYSFGVLAFRILTGEMPFERPPWLGDRDRWLRESLMLHVEAPPKRVAQTGAKVPRRLAAFVERCLRKDPDERFRDTREAYAELERIVRPGIGGRVAAAVGGTAAVAAAAFAIWAPAPAAPPLDATWQGNVIAGRDLHAGPARPALEVDVRKSVDGAHFALVTARDPGAARVEGWTVEPAGGTRVRVAPAEGAPGGRVAPVFLARAAADETAYTDAFGLVRVGPSDWSIAAVEAEGRDGRAVDPAGLRMLVRLRAEDASFARGLSLLRDVEGVSVASGAGHVPAVLDPQVSSEREAVYRLDLDHERLALEDGLQELRVVARDRADGEHSEALELEVVRREPRITEASLLSGENPTSLVVGDAEVRLVGPPGRGATFRWWVEDDAGRTLAGPFSEAGPRVEHEVPLRLARYGGGDWSGHVVVEIDDGALVARAEGRRSTDARRIAFDRRGEPVDFELLRGGVAVGADRIARVRDRVLDLAVARRHRFPVRVDVAWRRIAGTGAGAPSGSERVELAGAARERALELALPGDGRYGIVAEGRPLAADGSSVLEDQEPFRIELELVVDTSPPAVAIERPAPGFAVGVEAPEPFVLRVEDRAWVEDPPPVELVATVRIDGPAEDWGRREATWSLAASPGGTAALEPYPWLDGQPAEFTWDGRYALEVEARDEAGNAGSLAAPFEWTVARDGPRLVEDLPRPGAPWDLAGGAFRVRVEAVDPNGTERVTALLEDAGGGLEPRRLELERTAARTRRDGDRWEGGFELPGSWSGREVRLRLEATDGEGRSGTHELEGLTLATFESATPDHVVVSWKGRVPAPMRRVEGNDRFGYVLGGRTNFEENRTFPAHGLGPFTTLDVEMGHRIDVAAGALDDYYLDAHEVSVGDFLAFVEAAYDDPAHWPEGSAPPEGERDRLRDELRRLPPDLPVTGVTWDEASAFAAWAGKELPTWLQWEYAVRGGVRYLPYSCAPDPPPESGEHVTGLNVYGQAARDGVGPWPVEEGPDRSTAWDGIVNLCSNVAEWTRTPFQRRGRHDREVVLGKLTPAPDVRDHRVVGGSFRYTPFHIMETGSGGRNQRQEHVGFRCALEAGTVDAAFEGRGEGGYRVEALR